MITPNYPAPGSSATSSDAAWTLPAVGSNPGTLATATTPGSFANKPRIAPGLRGALTYSSPDTPNMPPVSDKTAWDFLPEGWSSEEGTERRVGTAHQDNSVGTAHQENSVGTSHQGSRNASDTKVGGAHPTVEFEQADGSLRRVTYPAGFTPSTQLESARIGIITPQMVRVAEREPHLTATQVRDEVAAGRMIILANKVHLDYQLDPMCIGRASKTKINANMGASPVSSGTDEEVEKLRWAEKWGADTVMDLSTGGDLDGCREALCKNSHVPIGTVPIYSMIIGRKIEELSEEIVMETLRFQASQGVDYFTIHAGVLKKHLKLAKNRLIGLVSRGGSMLAKWMLHHNRENLMNTAWEEICDIMREYDVTFSIGDGCRPGGLADASDALQLAELEELGKLTERAWRKGVQVMIEGPGHVPLDQIEFNMKLQRRLCHGAPFYVLGPLVTDIFPGYDHITSCIGATNAAYHGASMLCYVTPKEHLGLPKKDDVKQGCVAYKIAAHAADIALGIPQSRDRDDELTKARAALNWQKHFDLSFDPDTARAYHDEDMDVDTDFCAMCGHDWCSVRISKEIQEWASGKDEEMKWDKPVKTAALTPEQQEILAKRGVLSPDEIHKLASKTKKALKGAEASKAGTTAEVAEPDADKLSCHSDYVDADEAKKLQQKKLVQVNVAPALNLPTHDSVI